jgi:hypothetical protein
VIGKLTGTVDSVTLSTAIIDVGGVGYEVTLGARQLSALPPVGETVTLSIDTHFREDGVRLYGFATEHERAWFRALQTVQGVGAKVALGVLGTLSAADLANAVARQGLAQRSRPASSPSSRTRCRRWRPRSNRARDRHLSPRSPRGLRRVMRFRRSPILAMPMARRQRRSARPSAEPAAKRARRS